MPAKLSVDLADRNIKRHYWVWAAMLARCRNPNDKQYANYGGRGIAVCKEWHSFERFFADMGLRPTDDHTLERKDVNGNYCPENCCWIIHSEQAHNKGLYRKNSSGVSGVFLVRGTKWRARIRVSGRGIHLGYFDNLEDAAEARRKAIIKYGFSPSHGS